MLPLRFSRTGIDTTPAEPIGTSTEWAMREVLGLDNAQIAALDDAGAFGEASVS